MKVVTKCVIDMNTMETVSEESYEYDGPVAECKGGDGGYDSAYNERIATLMEGADERTQALFNDYYNGAGRQYDRAVTSAGLELLPKQTELAGLQLDSAVELTPMQADLSRAQLGLDLQAAERKSGILGEFYDSLGKNNPDTMAAQAGADMAEAYKNVRANDEMSQKRRGLYRPGTSAGLSYSEARDTAGAMSSARRAARDQNIEQYAMGLQI